VNPCLKRFLLGYVTIVVSATLVFFLFIQTFSIKNGTNDPVYVGVAFQGNTATEAKLLIDRVKDYTNLFVLGASPVSRNETATSEVADYAIANGLNLIVNFGYYDPHAFAPGDSWRNWTWQLPWLSVAKQKFGSRFLGVYFDDEPGGIQLDFDWAGFFKNYSWYFALPGDYSLKGIYEKLHTAQSTGSPPADYDLEAHYYVHDLLLENPGHKLLKDAGVMTITSDYGLYWFDYLGGYDVILAQLGWNHSVVQDLALVKAAAHLQDKSWGSIITWKYDKPPYLDSGKVIYEQMVQSYQAGARYIMIFNYPQLEGNAYGVMQDEHFAALEQFWSNVVQTNAGGTREYGKPDVALVLPRNYGWGMRSPSDKIWGIYGPDSKSAQIWDNSRKLLSKYGLRLDIVYDDPAFPLAGRYNKVYLWNETVM
jgi:hypothetical protein